MRVRFTAALLMAAAGCAGGGPAGAGRPSGPAPAGQEGPGPEGAARAIGGVAGARPVSQMAYRAHRVDSVVFQLPGGASQAQVAGRTAWLHLSVRPDSQGMVAEFVVDSLQADPGTYFPGPSLDSAMGARITGRILPSGGLANLALTPHSSLIEVLAQDLDRHFFPPLPAERPQPGTGWSDTAVAVIGTATDQNFLRDSVWTHYRVVRPEDDSLAGKDALAVEAAAEVRRSGRNSQADQQWEISGSGRDSTRYLYDRGGALVQLLGQEDLRLDYLVPAVGQTVPVRAIGHYRVRRLPQPASNSP